MLKFLNTIEAIGQRLPHPTLVFAGLCGVVILLSAIFAGFGLEAVHPITKEVIAAKNLLSPSGLLYLLTNTVNNYMSFAPLGPVLVAMLGIGLADHSGYFPKAVALIAKKAPSTLLSYVIVFTGVMSNIAADAGYVVLIPLAAALYISVGRHPLVGIAAAFAGVSGGFSANLLIGPVDIILTGLTLEAAHILEPTMQLNPSINYWFMLASTGFITLAGGLITDQIVEPYLSQSQPVTAKSKAQLASIQLPSAHKLNPAQVDSGNASRFSLATWVGFIYSVAVASLFIFDIAPTEAISGLVVLIAIGFALVGIIYGWGQSNWIVPSLETSLANLAGYLVLMFFAAQFVAYFNWTQLGLILAIQGSQLLTLWDIPASALLIVVILFSASVNLFIGSASAKWALMAPILIPMLMLLEIDPAYAQLAYRIGDSSTNIITPLMPYFALILAYAQQHNKFVHFGTIIAMMLPYSILFLIGWSLLLIVWLEFNLPIGF